MELANEKNAFLVTFILSKGNCFSISILSQCLVCLINFQNICTFTYQKSFPHKLLLLVFKTIESLQCNLKGKHMYIEFTDTFLRMLQKYFSCSDFQISLKILQHLIVLRFLISKTLITKICICLWYHLTSLAKWLDAFTN